VKRNHNREHVQANVECILLLPQAAAAGAIKNTPSKIITTKEEIISSKSYILSQQAWSLWTGIYNYYLFSN
jgi:hypothetical protein